MDCLKKRLWGDTHYLLKLDTAAVNGTEWERLVNFVTCLLSAAFIFLPFISSIYIYQRRSQWPLCAGVNAHALCLSLAKAGLLLQRCNHQGVLPWTLEDSKTYESSQTEHKTSRNVKQDATSYALRGLGKCNQIQAQEQPFIALRVRECSARGVFPAISFIFQHSRDGRFKPQAAFHIKSHHLKSSHTRKAKPALPT